MMASRTGKTDAIKVLLDNGAQGQREGDLGRDDRPDVGRFRAPSGGRQDAHRPRRGRQCPFAISCRPPTAAALKAGRRWLPSPVKPRRSLPAAG